MELVLFLLVCLALAAGDYTVEEQQISNDFDVQDSNDKKGYHFSGFEPRVIEYKNAPCTKEVENEIMRMKMENLCVFPVEVYVNTTVDDKYSYAPTRVKVKRCGGMCKLKQACMPVGEKKFAKIPVERTMLITKEKDCAYAVVEEHTDCMCKCVEMKDDCDEKQVFNMNTCRCECEDSREKRRSCKRMENHQWDSEKCKCQCEEVKRCYNGKVWNNEMCKCEKRHKRLKSLHFGRNY